MAKNVFKNNDLINELGKVTTTYNNTETEQVLSDELTDTISFYVAREKIDFLRDFVLFKRKSDLQFYHYSQTSAFREGLDLMQEKFNFSSRPTAIPVPTSSGTTGRQNDRPKVSTSFRVSPKQKNLFYDIIYHKSNGNSKIYTKEDFLQDMIDELKAKYQLKK